MCNRGIGHTKPLGLKSKISEDGVIFISIDDHEVENLKKICDEVFGEVNFVSDFIRKTKSMTGDEGTGH